ncbi:MAG TPA: class I SAM-dependent methyltransferase, partial [Bacillaceae bacterium]
MKKMAFDNFEEYMDPVLYDIEHDGYQNDIPFLQKWAAKVEGTIIDIACGTGRAAIPLARKGYRLMGVDAHLGMLNEAKRKASREGLHIEWAEQDCSALNVPITSPLVYSVGNSFQHFLTNEAQDGLLTSVNRHLKTGGIFIFDTRFPSAEELLQPSTEEYWRSYTDPGKKLKVDVYTISRYEALAQVQHYTTIRRYRNEAGELVDEKRTNISL